MQTRKKTQTRNASREHANPRTCRQPKKVTAAAEKKVTDLITSSAKKHKSVIGLKKKIDSQDAGRNLMSGSVVAECESEGILVANEASLEHKKSDDSAMECARGSIFSPAFHYTKEDDGDISGNVDFMDQFKDRDRIDRHDFIAEEANHVNSSFEDDFSALGNLSSEVSAIYLAMQHSKLECIDEQSQDSMSTDGCVEPDETDDLADFDPYMFIKDLPDLSVVVPKFRPMLLPKQTRSCPSTTLVLDLDETLVHSTLEPCEDADFTFPVNFNLKEHRIYVKCRPYLKDFLDRVASLFETIIFTASQSIYAEQLLNILDPKRKLLRHRVYRESCVYVEGNYLKDLSVLGRDLARVIIIDNSPQAFGFQLDNGVPIESWFDDRNDRELLSLLPFLESLVGVEDVRPLIARKFNLREKVASAACLSIDFGT